jgi:hypothetical protein
MSREELREKMSEMAAELIEHGEAVVILLSLQDDEYTYTEHTYRGNWHTALGLVEAFKLGRTNEQLMERLKGDES